MFGKRDPVCGSKVGRGKGYSLEYEGKVYYFDSLACKATFQEDPHRFLGGKSDGGFLKKLSSSSSEVPRSCCDLKK